MENEKKIYPSQVNTKTISTRVPIENYVELLNEAVNRGITLSDYLLLKIYDKQKKLSGVINENIEEDENNIENENNNDIFPIVITTKNHQYYDFQDENDIENTLEKLEESIAYFQKKSNENYMSAISPNLNDINIRNAVFVAIIDKINSVDWESNNDKISVRKEFRLLWKDIFDL